jgi:hypothetical protein
MPPLDPEKSLIHNVEKFVEPTVVASFVTTEIIKFQIFEGRRMLTVEIPMKTASHMYSLLNAIMNAEPEAGGSFSIQKPA